MPFDHNDHDHRLLRQLPRGCRTVLDVGCGTGRFARRLVRRDIEVDAADRSAEVIWAARAASAPPAGGGGVRYLLAGITRVELPAGGYDYISCLEGELWEVTQAWSATAALRQLGPVPPR